MAQLITGCFLFGLEDMEGTQSQFPRGARRAGSARPTRCFFSDRGSHYV